MRTHSKDTSARVLRLTYSALYLAIALVLPFLTGQIPQIGSMLCPMHIPALLCGFVCGWPWGLAVGFIAPLLRSALFGMPTMFPAAVAMAAGWSGVLRAICWRGLNTVRSLRRSFWRARSRRLCPASCCTSSSSPCW